MALKHKPLGQQVIVITGASSGIGLATARLAAGRGAKLVLASRNAEALAALEREITGAGGQAAHVVADVGSEQDVNRIQETAIARFGTFDTWVNNAAASIYGRLDTVSLEDARRLFDTNFWGQVYGSLAAVRHFIGRGGNLAALINVGSTVSDRALPIQGFYSASKHAVQGFTDALRMELEEAGAPVSVTLIKPGSVDTPFPRHAKNYMDREPALPPPVYDPRVVARAVLHCAQTPEREVFVGGGGKMISTLGKYAPRLADKVMQRNLIRQQQKDEPARDREGALYAPAGPALEERGDYEGHVMKTSLYTQASLHPWVTGMVLGAAGVAVAGALAADRRRE